MVKGFYSFIHLFPLDRCRWLACYIVDDAVDVFALVHNPFGNTLEHVPVDPGEFACHAVDARYGTDADCMVVCSIVSHDADGADVGADCEVLPDFAVES